MTTVVDLSYLEGDEVGQIWFHHDYVELNWDGPFLRCLAGPIVVVGNTRYEFPDEESIDALCGLIGQSVVSTADERTRLVVEFERATVIVPKEVPGERREVARLVPLDNGSCDPSAARSWESVTPSV